MSRRQHCTKVVAGLSASGPECCYPGVGVLLVGLGLLGDGGMCRVPVGDVDVIFLMLVWVRVVGILVVAILGWRFAEGFVVLVVVFVVFVSRGFGPGGDVGGFLGFLVVVGHSCRNGCIVPGYRVVVVILLVVVVYRVVVKLPVVFVVLVVIALEVAGLVGIVVVVVILLVGAFLRVVIVLLVVGGLLAVGLRLVGAGSIVIGEGDWDCSDVVRGGLRGIVGDNILGGGICITL